MPEQFFCNYCGQDTAWIFHAPGRSLDCYCTQCGMVEFINGRYLPSSREVRTLVEQGRKHNAIAL